MQLMYYVSVSYTHNDKMYIVVYLALSRELLQVATRFKHRGYVVNYTRVTHDNCLGPIITHHGQKN